jgi:hypothetical protein
MTQTEQQIWNQLQAVKEACRKLTQMVDEALCDEDAWDEDAQAIRDAAVSFVFRRRAPRPAVWAPGMPGRGDVTGRHARVHRQSSPAGHTRHLWRYVRWRTVSGSVRPRKQSKD